MEIQIIKYIKKKACCTHINMIIKIQGGLGNQLFQYAYGRKMELSGKKVVFDVSFFEGVKAKGDMARNFKLNNYNIETKAKFSNKNANSFYRRILNKIVVRIVPKEDGFWQSEKYFKDIENDIRKEFTLKNQLSSSCLDWQKKIQTTENSVSLHIRRGDYVQDQKTNAFHGTCDMSYYQTALEKVTKILQNKNIEIFVFSDDIEWAKENLKFPYITHFVSSPDIQDYEELFLMSLCKHNVIANSTFSWWGAWLNQYQNKIVVGPKQWFANKTTEGLDILPPEWIKI